MITPDGTRCSACNSAAPDWKYEGDYDSPEDYRQGYLGWLQAHEQCVPAKPQPVYPEYPEHSPEREAWRGLLAD
jgi:hypothetical protein